MSFDFIIAGGGTAGCVLAARLSSNPSNRVLLIEAGRDYMPGEEPDSISTAGFRAHHDPAFFDSYPEVELGLSAQMGGTQKPRLGRFRVPQVMGGGSSVNGMHAQRGTPDDYDAWSGLGVRGWGWKDVLPYFQRLETDSDFNSAEHGNSGPIRIRRVGREDWSAFSRAVAEELVKRGVPACADLATASGDCVGPVPLNINGTQRSSVVAGYLDRAVRTRPNLMIVERTRVERLLFDGTRVTGVEVDLSGTSRRFEAREIILSLGALGSPILLLRSGIGPGEDLQRCQIPVRVNRPGVGRLLINHAHLSLAVQLRKSARQSVSSAPPCTMVARYSSHVPACPPTDMMLNVWERTPGALSWDPLARRFAIVMVLLNAPCSVGDLKLEAAAPQARPRIRFNVLGDDRDLVRMTRSVLMVNGLLSAPCVSPLVGEALIPLNNWLATIWNANTLRAMALSTVGAVALSGPTELSRRVLTGQGILLASLVKDGVHLREVVVNETRPASHATATCRMGDPGDRYAVTDSRCRVIGAQGLRVVDCSIFPTALRAGTHIPAIMAAEKAADMILEDFHILRRSGTLC